jgi:ATP/maltotriose-dependent transcriptional regulator MalT
MGAVEADMVFTIWRHASRGYLALVEGEVGSALAVLAQARALGERAGYTFGQAVATHHSLQAMVQTGNGERTEAFARELVTLCEPLGLSYLIDYAVYARARLALAEGRLTEAVASFRSLLDCQDVTMVSRAHACLAHARIAEGDRDAAEREATTAMEKGALFPDARAIALSALAQLALLRDQPSEALAFSERGLAAQAHASEASTLRLTRAEALRALGRTSDACGAIGEGRDRILTLAGSLDDPELRASFLTTVSANARTLQLASEWLATA